MGNACCHLQSTSSKHILSLSSKHQKKISVILYKNIKDNSIIMIIPLSYPGLRAEQPQITIKDLCHAFSIICF